VTTWRPFRERAEREPRPVRDSLEVLAARLGAPNSASLAAVFGHWEEAVGPAVAAHCRPSSLVNGVLVVEVDDPAWATQLRYLGSTVVERFAVTAGPGVVARIEVRVRRS
jgi:predicted nucleic acid-binding Zn ribbon protein